VELEHEADVAVAEIGKFPARHLGGVNAVNADRTCIGLVQGADDLQQRGLSCAAGAYNTYYLSFVDVEVDAFQYFQ